LGTALLRHFRVAIDQFHGCVTFSRASGEPLTSGTVRGTGVGLVNDGTHWTVGYLIEGTAAVASGLRVGDELLAIGGVGAADLSRGRLGRLLDEHDVLRFRVRDGNDVREVDVPVAVLVR
jgi:C-terminal processing protease CtpA/Prc